MATDLSTSSLFASIRMGWQRDGGIISSVTFQTNTDESTTKINLQYPRDYENIADGSHLDILRQIYASEDGLQDDDGFTLVPEVYAFNLSEDDITPEELSSYGSFNPLVAAEYDGWKTQQKIEGANIREATYSEDADTNRPRIEHSYDDVPVHRNPGSSSYEFSLEKWTVMQIGTTIEFRRTWSVDDDVTASNINDEFSVLAFIDWIDDLRTSGDEVVQDITNINSFNSRVFQLVQGTGFDTLDLEFLGRGHSIRDDGTHEWVSVSFRRASSETGTIDIGAIRTILGSATGTLDTSDEEDTPEIPVRGATTTPIYASEVIFPDNVKMRPVGERLTIVSPGRGQQALDEIRGLRFADLDDISGVTNGKYMPDDGAAVIHFGHDETANSILRYRDIEQMVTSDGSDVLHRIHNISTLYDVEMQDDDNGNLLTLKPFQQSGPMQVSIEEGGESGEILAINPPDRHLYYARGVSSPNFADGTSYADSSASNADDYHSLRFNNSSVEYIDTDVFTLGAADDPASAVISTVDNSDWDIRGSFSTNRPGWINIQMRYRLVINPPAPSGQLATGNGPSLWIIPGGTGSSLDLARDHFSGGDPLGGIGGSQEYHLVYHGKRIGDAHFIFLHRIPNSSTIAAANYDHIDMSALAVSVSMRPEIRKVITL